MDKNKTIESIQKARKAHLAQMDKIAAVIAGEKVDNPTAVASTECDFGKWLYADENKLEEILGSLFFSKLEVMHSKWHLEYARVFEIFFKDKDKKRGIFSKLMASNKIDPLEMDKAKLYYTELQATTAELLKIIDSSERRINAMNEGKFH